MANIFWNNTAGGDWNTSTNWNTSTVPTSADNVYLTAVGTYTVTSSQDNSVNALGMQASATLDITGNTFAIANGSGNGGLKGVIDVENAATLDLGGSITNSGTINENGGANSTRIALTSVDVVLNGKGKVNLSNNANNLIFATNGSFLLDNIDNTISGAGDIGNGQMTLANEAAGVIDANQSTALILDTAGNTISNAGVLEATAGGTLTVASTVANSSTGKIIADGGVVQLLGGFSGGSLVQKNGGTIQTTGSATLDGLGNHPVTTSGQVSVANGGSLTILGKIINTGTIALQSTGGNTGLVAGSAIVTLTGGGAVTLSNSTANFLGATNGSYRLVNLDNTISGAGNLGNGQLTLTNDKLINANQLTALVISSPNPVTNAGTLESTNTTSGNGGLNLNGSAIDNTSTGVIQAVGPHSHVDLNGANIIGGTLKTFTGGIIQTVGGSSRLDGQSNNAPVNNLGYIAVSNNTTLALVGTINNAGTINLTAGVNNAVLQIASQTVTLAGGGTLLLSNNANNQVLANSSNVTLLNVNDKITGAGQLGAGSPLGFTNQAGGLLNANQANSLILNSGGALVVNQGTFEDTGSGGLVIQNTVVNNAGGTIEAVGTTAHVDLSGGYIEGGTFVTVNGGVIDSGNGNVDGQFQGAVNNTGLLRVNEATSLTLEGVINNTGTVLLAARTQNNVTDLRLNSQTVTFQGKGQVQLTNNANNRIYANAANEQLVNVDNTISGAGQIGAQTQMGFTNEAAGIVNANQGVALVVNTSNIVTVNQGTFEATGKGGLQIQSAVNNAGGTIEAIGTAVSVQLAGGYIEGGLLTTSAGGAIKTVSGSGGSLDGITGGAISNTGSVIVSDNSSLTLFGVINNKGTISMASVGDITDIHLAYQTVTLQGGGQVVLSNNNNNRIFGNAGSDLLDNIDNVISGAGQLGASQMTFRNEVKGVVNANQPAVSGHQRQFLTLNTSGSLTRNLGTLEATAGGALAIQSTVDNGGGTILATGTGSLVKLANGSVEGGTLITASGGLIDGSNASLDGITDGVLTFKGNLTVTDNSALTLYGTINNQGAIILNSGGNATSLIVGNKTVALTGGGRVVLGVAGPNRILGNAGTFTLDNVDNTIQGAGQLGSNQMQLTNGGTINANQTTALTVNLGLETGVNNGLMEGTSTGGLALSNGIYTNNGTVAALNGSKVSYDTSANNTNNTEGQLAGGTWKSISTGQGSTLSITGGAVTIDAATIVLSGAGSVFQAGDGSTFSSLESSLTTVAAGASLQILGNRNYATPNSLSDSGLLQLGGGTLNANSLTVLSGAYVLGFGTVQPSIANAGIVEAKGGVLTLRGAGSGKGQLKIDASSTLNVFGSESTTQAVNFNGSSATLELENILTFGPASGTGGGASGIHNFDQNGFSADVIDVITFGTGTTFTVTQNSSSSTINLTNGATHAGVTLFGNYAASGFQVASSSAGSLITYSPPAATVAQIAVGH